MSASKLTPVAPKGRSSTMPAMTDEMRYRAQDAMHTIARAEDHKRDSELMNHVRALADDVRRATGGDTMRREEGKMRGGEKGRSEKPKNPSNSAMAGRGVAALRRNQAGGNAKRSKPPSTKGAKMKVR